MHDLVGAGHWANYGEEGRGISCPQEPTHCLNSAQGRSLQSAVAAQVVVRTRCHQPERWGTGDSPNGREDNT